MTRLRREDTADLAREIASDVFCLGPWGRTQTDVYFVRTGSSWVLIDAGWASDLSQIQRAAGALFGADSRPAAILLTHCHPDNAGSARQLALAWGCAVYMHPDELPLATADFAAMVASAGPLDRYLILPLMRVMGRRRREAVLARSSLGDVARVFEPGAGVPGLPGWEWVPTPGHTPGHVSYFRPSDRVLITGDALVTCRSTPGPVCFYNGRASRGHPGTRPGVRERPGSPSGGSPTSNRQCWLVAMAGP